jgi:anti-anti-sigma factor
LDTEYQILVEDNKGVIVVDGDFDNEQAGESLRIAVNKVIERDLRTIVLDLRKVEIINEFGLGKMILLERRLVAEDRVLMIKPLTGFVKEVMELLMLNELFPIDDGSTRSQSKKEAGEGSE